VVPEIWIEKDSPAVFDEIAPIAQRRGVRVLVGQGYQSETAAANLVRRASDDGRPRLVLWLADADSHGESMAAATARHIEFLCRHWLAEHEPEVVVPRILTDRVALTLGQVAEIEQSIGRAIHRSPDEGREQGRVELQALPAFAPGWLAEELERRLDEITDGALDDELSDWEDEAQEAIEQQWDERTRVAAMRVGVLDGIRDTILQRFDIAGLRAALRPLQAQLDEVADEFERIQEAFRPELPELPVGASPVCAQTREGLGAGTCSPPTRSVWRDSTPRPGAPVGVDSPTR
jgi:hypothetical protein